MKYLFLLALLSSFLFSCTDTCICRLQYKYPEQTEVEGIEKKFNNTHNSKLVENAGNSFLAAEKYCKDREEYITNNGGILTVPYDIECVDFDDND